MGSLFCIEIIFNIFEGNGLYELLGFENVYLSLIIFEIYWLIYQNEDLIIFNFIHVTFSGIIYQ